ncbi:hypothetical protein [Actinomyces sp. Z3]|uniref:hypothetical protein n=1 Tax=Actinomyces sp. Z3 TaxID=2250217 RepID=UPI0015EB91DD|nr:hypothetical protein [Actinomyces sp. Z3]
MPCTGVWQTAGVWKRIEAALFAQADAEGGMLARLLTRQLDPCSPVGPLFPRWTPVPPLDPCSPVGPP